MTRPIYGPSTCRNVFPSPSHKKRLIGNSLSLGPDLNSPVAAIKGSGLVVSPNRLARPRTRSLGGRHGQRNDVLDPTARSDKSDLDGAGQSLRTLLRIWASESAKNILGMVALKLR